MGDTRRCTTDGTPRGTVTVMHGLGGRGLVYGGGAVGGVRLVYAVVGPSVLAPVSMVLGYGYSFGVRQVCTNCTD